MKTVIDKTETTSSALAAALASAGVNRANGKVVT
jgi:hypothetical protein